MTGIIEIARVNEDEVRLCPAITPGSPPMTVVRSRFLVRWNSFLSLGLSLLSSSTWGYSLSNPAAAQPSLDGTPSQSAPTQCISMGMPSATWVSLARPLVQDTTAVGASAIALNYLADQLIPNLGAMLNPKPFPEIHERARAARVPVMMYHDILPEKQVSFDVTPAEFEAHLQAIRDKNLTPISLDQLMVHLRTGMPLPPKPILLTFDDGYEGHYTHVYPLLKKYNYPAVFSIYTAKVGKKMGRSSLNWEQVREMAKDPLITIASHSVTHPADLTKIPEEQLKTEITESKQVLERELGIPIHYFTYPEGKYNQQVANLVQQAGYSAALTMNDLDERLAGQSESLLAIGRIGQSRIAEMLDQAWGGAPLPKWNVGFDFKAPIQKQEPTIENTGFVFISGGQPMTIHAKTRDQVPAILAGTPAIAGVDGGFFSLEFLDSNKMIGPVYSQASGEFVPGNDRENLRLNGRPLVLISPDEVRYIPFDAAKHNSLAGIQAEMPKVTDAFVAAAWLVRDGQAQPDAAFGNLFDFNAERHRAFWGINQAGQPMIGVSKDPIGSVNLGQKLLKAGYRDAVMLDSGASTSLAFQGESLVAYTPRPVPHVVGLIPTNGIADSSGNATGNAVVNAGGDASNALANNSGSEGATEINATVQSRSSWSDCTLAKR
ncbi:MAG: polysaccharide deacetylase [Alkalinema sp. CACIAM 70d]|nr:MAG: polysaccharide deacetylase [Alkalinema sp. CACIAM 70d]